MFYPFRWRVEVSVLDGEPLMFSKGLEYSVAVMSGVVSFMFFITHDYSGSS